MKRLAGKVVVVSGAGYGLGRALAIGMAREGANLALLARNDERLQDTGRIIIAAGQRAFSKAIDIANWSQVMSFADSVRAEFGRVDILVNNAAGWVPGPLVSQDVTKLSEMVNTTITGNLFMTKAFLSIMLDQRSGHVFNITSTAAKPRANPANSSVTFIGAKAGLAAASDALRSEVASQGIRVTTVYPGSFASRTELDDSMDTIRQRYSEAAMPLGDIVELLIFVASQSLLVVDEITFTSPFGDT